VNKSENMKHDARYKYEQQRDILILHLAGWLKESSCMRQWKIHFVLENNSKG
jgi:hypothetical protein